MSTPRYRSTPPSRSGSAISVSTATIPSSPGLKSLMRGGRYPKAGRWRARTIGRRMAHAVTLVPGDGTGPELTEATRRVLEATGVAFDWDVRHAGVDVMEEAGTPLPVDTLASIKRNGVALKGPITTPIGTGFRS